MSNINLYSQFISEQVRKSTVAGFRNINEDQQTYDIDTFSPEELANEEIVFINFEIDESTDDDSWRYSPEKSDTIEKKYIHHAKKDMNKMGQTQNGFVSKRYKFKDAPLGAGGYQPHEKQPSAKAHLAAAQWHRAKAATWGSGKDSANRIAVKHHEDRMKFHVQRAKELKPTKRGAPYRYGNDS